MENMNQNNGGNNQNQNYQNQNYQNQNNQNQNYNNGNNNGGEGNEYFIGPHCGSGEIGYAVFYDEECMYLANGMQVQDALYGYNPDTSRLTPKYSIPCNANVSFLI